VPGQRRRSCLGLHGPRRPRVRWPGPDNGDHGHDDRHHRDEHHGDEYHVGDDDRCDHECVDRDDPAWCASSLEAAEPRSVRTGIPPTRDRVVPGGWGRPSYELPTLV
jgi:hypothetical protein